MRRLPKPAGLPPPTPIDGRTLGQAIPHLAPGQAQLVTFTGKRGQGKTTGASAYLERREPRVLVLTPHQDYQGIRQVETIEEAIADLARGGACRRRVVLPPGETQTHEFGELFFAMCADAAQNGELSDCIVHVAEIHLFEKPQASQNLTFLVTQGRHYGIRMSCDTQRIALVPGIVLSETTHLACFKVTRPRDLDVIAEWADDEIAQNVRMLDIGKCLLIEL